MSSLRALMVAALLGCAPAVSWTDAAQFPATSAEYVASGERKFEADDLPGAIADFTQAIALDTTNAQAHLYRGVLRIDTGDLAGAGTDLARAVVLDPSNPAPHAYLGVVKLRSGDIDGAIVDSRRAVDLDPDVLLGYRTLIAAYWERAYKDPSLTDSQKREATVRGIAATDGALAIAPDDVEALVFKGLFLRAQALVERDPGTQAALIEQADALSSKAEAIRGRATADAPAAPPPLQPLRVGGLIPQPRKVVHVDPVYPPIAVSARVTGLVIVEITIDTEGRVVEARILRSIPLLDAAALTAVRQWVYTPTYFDGALVPLIMTVTVSFTLS